MQKTIFIAIAVALAALVIAPVTAYAQTTSSTTTTTTTGGGHFRHFGFGGGFGFRHFGFGNFGFFNRGLIFNQGLASLGLQSSGSEYGSTSNGAVVILSTTPGAQVFQSGGSAFVNPCAAGFALLSSGSCVAVAQADNDEASGAVVSEQAIAPAASNSVVVATPPTSVSSCGSILPTPVIVSTGQFGGLFGGFDNFGGFHHGDFHRGDHVTRSTTTTTTTPATTTAAPAS